MVSAARIMRLEYQDGARHWLRGFVVVLMAVDHASAIFNAGRVADDNAVLHAAGSALPAAQFFTRYAPVRAGHPGREFAVEAPMDGKPTKFRVRLYVVHDRLFRIVVRTGEKDDFEKEAEKVFASFKLGPEYAQTHTEVVKFDWQPFSAVDGSFTAKFPVVAPRVMTRKINDIDITTVVGSAAYSYAVFIVGYYDEPAGAKDATEDQKFAALIENSTAATNTKLVGTPEPAPLGKIAGRKFTLESQGGLMKIEGRAYLHGKRHFFIQAQRPRNSTVEQAEIDAFLSAFALGKAK